MKCPNCGVQINRFDISENCKNCGINLFYSQQETVLSRDAKHCELEFASFRILVSKLKTSFIGSKLVVLRLVFSVICVATLLIPFAEISVKLPLVSKKLSFGGIGIYNAFSDGTLDVLFDFMKLSISKDVAIKSIILILLIVLTALVSATILVLEILSFINIRKTAKCMKISSVTGILLSAVSVTVAVLLTESSFDNSVYCSFGFGGIVSALLFFVIFLINSAVLKKDIKPDVSEVDLKRTELYKKVKNGEISIDDLPLPVFEERKNDSFKNEKKKFGRRNKK